MKIKEIGESIINNWPVKILSLAIAVLLFYFYRLNTTEEYYINVPLEIILNDNFVVADTHPTDVRISLRGSSESFFLINEKDITAYVDFSAKEKSGLYREPIKIKKRGNALSADPLEIKVKPTEIRLRIEQKYVKKVPVIPVIKGLSSGNYEVVDSSIKPDIITIEGPQSIVEKITLIKTEDINIQNRKESFVIPVKLEKINDLAKIVEGNEVQFYGKVGKNFVSRNIGPIEIELKGKNNNMVYDIDFKTGSINLEAEKNIINFIDSENCYLYVDLSEFDTPGIYNLPVIVSISGIKGEVLVTGFTPETVTVNIVIKGR